MRKVKRTALVRVERRHKDGLGLLPRVVDPEQRRRRQRANTLVGLLLVLVGGGIEGGSVAFLQRQSAAAGWLSLLFGIVTLAQGVWLVGRQDRRRDSRDSRDRASQSRART